MRGKSMEPPVKPDESNCCNSGCNPCIFDVYEEQLKKYERLKLSNAERTGSPNCIDQLKYAQFKLYKIEAHTAETCSLVFSCVNSNADSALQYGVGQHFLLKAYSTHSQSYFTRAYTPIPSKYANKHCFVILVRLYKKGAMSRVLKSLRVGDVTLWRGPYGDYIPEYKHKSMLLIAQGTGIAPIYSVLVDLLLNEDCETVVKLFFCCRNKSEVLLHDELYDLCRYWNFSYEVFLSDETEPRARYNEVVHCARLELGAIRDYIVGKEGVKVLVCGGENFNSCMVNYVVECGVDKIHIHSFYNIFVHLLFNQCKVYFLRTPKPVLIEILIILNSFISHCLFKTETIFNISALVNLCVTHC